MSNHRVCARNLAKRLIQENQNNRSWRTIAREDFPAIVRAGTLNRIAKSNGDWVPKSKELRVALGLCEAPPIIPTWVRSVKRKIAGLAKETRIEIFKYQM